MKKGLLLWVTGLSLLLTISGCDISGVFNGDDDDPTKGGVEGTVYEDGTTDPIIGALVVVGEGGDIWEAVSLLPDGEYSLSNIPAGTLVIAATAVGYEPYADTITIEAGETVVRDIYLTVSPPEPGSFTPASATTGFTPLNTDTAE